MTVFDTTLEAPPVAEQNNDPILPEQRFIFELIGFERTQPDQWRKNGGVRWTFAVYEEDGRTPFIFQDDPYELWRMSNVNAAGQPLFNLGTQAHEWASALLGRPLGVDDNFSISELRDKRMSAMVVWTNQKTDPKKKSVTLASLRHVPVGGARNGAATVERPARTQVSSDPSGDDIDRALLFSKLEKKVARLAKRDAKAGAAARAAFEASDPQADLSDIQTLIDQVDDTLDALDD